MSEIRKYRIIYKSAGNKKDAEKAMNGIKDKVSNPQVVFSSSTGSWNVVLYESQSRQRIDDAYKHYRDDGLQIFIQMVV